MRKVLIDTDIKGAAIGGDIDDGLALVAALRSDRLSVEGIIATGGDFAMKVAQIRRIFELPGKTAPLGRGAHVSLDGREARDDSVRPPTASFLSKHRGTRGIPLGVDLLCEQVIAWRQELTLLARAQPTTLALALRYRPELKDMLGSVIISAGCLSAAREEPTAAYDPHALALVLRLIAPKVTLVGMDVADLVAFRATEVEAVNVARSDLAAFFVEYCQAGLGYHERDHCHPQASLAVLSAGDTPGFAVGPRTFVMEPCNPSWPGLTVPCDGPARPTARHEPITTNVTHMVDSERCRRRLAELWDVPDLVPT